MIITYNSLLNKYANYAAPKNKISRLVKEGAFKKVTRGIYETDKSISGYLLAGIIYGPSYLSFDYALSYYGLIPEAVYTFTSACFEKKKQKKYITEFGSFTYRDIPSKAYPLDVLLKEEKGYHYKIASPEKALCDKLYSVSTVKNKEELKVLLFSDLRIDKEEFNKLDKDKLIELSKYYGCTNLKLLAKILR